MKKQAFNPYLPSWEYTPDCEPYVFGDRVYSYGSHDRFNSLMYCLNDYVCYSAPVDDLSDWRYEGVIYKKTDDPLNKEGLACLYAPDVTQGSDGRYYLYYVLDHVSVVSVAVSDTPAGRYEFYGCEKLQEIHFYGTLREVGGGVFTGCRNIRSLTVHMGVDEESALRDFVTEINERVTVHVFIQSGQNRMQDERDTDSARTSLASSTFEEENGETETARVIFPEYYDEAVENTPARITVSNIHGAGQKYRYCFEGRKFRFDRYDKMFVYEKAEESVLMASKIAVTRLQYPKGLWESAKKEYEKFLMENLYEVLLGSLEDPEMVKWLAGQYLTPEKNPLTADKMSGLITEISKKHLPELSGMFMEIQRKKFGVKKKKFDFDL